MRIAAPRAAPRRRAVVAAATPPGGVPLDATPPRTKLDAKWRFRLDELRAWAAANGGSAASVPREHPYTELADWVVHQKRLAREGSLPPERVSSLRALGVVFDAYTDGWEARFAEFRDFMRAHGHTEVPAYQQEYKVLRAWVKRQREQLVRGELRDDRAKALEELSYAWGSSPAAFGQGVRQLRAYMRASRHGACTLPRRGGRSGDELPAQIRVLREWTDLQRLRRAHGTLPPGGVDALDALGFDWRGFMEQGADPASAPPVRATRPPTRDEVAEAAWQARFAELKDYVAANDGAFPKRTSSTRNESLNVWVAKQRLYNNKSAKGEETPLTPAQRAALDAIGFPWNPRADAWAEQLAELKKYAAQHGGCTDLPVRGTNGRRTDFSLWVFNQRRAHAHKMLSPEKAVALDALGYAWDDSENAFEHGRAQLAAFAAANSGSVLLPRELPEFIVLREWADMQRLRRAAGMMRVDRIAALSRLGFEWGEYSNRFEEMWELRFKELQAYAAAHGGSTRVPFVAFAATPEEKELERLYNWTRKQRNDKHAGVLSAERIAKLEALGFQWRLVE